MLPTSTLSTTSHNHSDGFELDKVLRSDASIALLTIVFFFIVAATLFGNIIVIIAILTYRQLKTQQSNLFILNLAIADISVALTVMVWSTVAFMLDMGREESHPWVFSTGMCYFQCAMNYCLIVVSMMTLGFISIDRFVHIVYPLRYHEIMTVKRIRIMICWTWIQGLIIGFIPVGMEWIHYDYCEVVCAIDWTSKHADKFVIVAFITCFLAPAFTMLVCYSVIFKKSLAYTAEIRRSLKLVNGSSEKSKTSFDNVGSLKKSGKQQTYEVKGSSIKDGGERNGKLSSSVSVNTSTKIRRHNSTVKESTIIKSLLIVVLVFFICMTPFSVTKLIKVLKYHVPCWVNTLATFIQLLASACNPLIYGIFRKEYRKAFKIQYNKACHRMQSRLASSEFSDSFSSPYYADNKVPTLKKRQQAAEAVNREKLATPPEDATPDKNDNRSNTEDADEQPMARIGEEKGVIQLRENEDSPTGTPQRKTAVTRRSVSFSSSPNLVNQITENITL